VIGQVAKDIAVVISVVGMWSIAATVVGLRVVKAQDKRKATHITALDRLHNSIVASERNNQERHETIMEHMRESHAATMQLINDTLEKCNGQ
jgi:Flp pilus assembly protein TadB